MSSRILADNAPAYWDAGYSPLPLTGKTPVVPKWNSFGDNLPNPERRAQWITQYPHANTDLALGKELVPGFRFGALDIDDERFVDFAQAIVGIASPAKVGRKGRTFFCLFDKTLKSTTLKSTAGKHAGDVLIASRQTVIPPSIHPETRAAYEWSSKPLLDYQVADLPLINRGTMDVVSTVIVAQETEQLLRGSGTHDAGLVLTAKLAAVTDDDELVVRAITSLFPSSYRGNSLDEVVEWIASARAKGFRQANAVPIDVAVAEAVAVELAPLKYTNRDGFLRYQAGFWSPVETNDIRRSLKSQLTPRIGAKGTVAGYLQKAELCLVLDVEDPRLARSEGMVCLTNGSLIVRTGQLVAHSPEHRLRFGLDFPWDPDAKCPTYLEQLRATLRGDESAIAAFEEFAGLTLIDEQKFQRALFLMGEGGSGKSTLLRTIEMMHDPKAVSVTPLDKLEDDRYRTDVAGKLVNISYDVQTGQRIFGETFVRITGGDPIAVRRLFKEVEGVVHPSVRFVGSMNPDMPPYQGAPDALRRRLIILPCGDRIREPDADRLPKIASEKAGILVRWVAALNRLYERGRFDPPEASAREVDEYLLAYEPFGAFLDDRLVADSVKYVAVSEVTAEFNKWATSNQEKPISPVLAGRKLKKHGFRAGQEKVGPNKTNTRVVYALWKRPPVMQRPRF